MHSAHPPLERKTTLRVNGYRDIPSILHFGLIFVHASASIPERTDVDTSFILSELHAVFWTDSTNFFFLFLSSVPVFFPVEFEAYSTCAYDACFSLIEFQAVIISHFSHVTPQHPSETRSKGCSWVVSSLQNPVSHRHLLPLLRSSNLQSCPRQTLSIAPT